MGTGGDGTRNLSTKPTSNSGSNNVAGALHTYIWDSIADIGTGSTRGAQIRITPYDPQPGRADTTPSFGVVNTALRFATKVTTDHYYYSYSSSNQNPAVATATLEVVNRDRIPAEFWFGTSQRFDFIVRELHGREVYRWSWGKSFLQVVGVERLYGGRKLVYTVKIPLIDQRNKSRPTLLPGRYTLEGVLTSRRPMRGIITFEIIKGSAPVASKATTAPPSPGRAADYFGVTVSCDRPLYTNNLMPPVRNPEPVMNASLCIFNFRPNPVEFTLSDYGFDFVIRDMKGTEVWRWSYGKPMPDCTFKKVLANDKFTKTLSFKVTDNQGGMLRPGMYVLEAYTTSKRRMMAQVTFEVKNIY
jgi:hypothetical protein